MFLAVSTRLSPFSTLEVEPWKLTVSADNRLAASSKLVRVRVEDSKNRLAMVLPRNEGTFFTWRAETSLNDSAVFSSNSDLAAAEHLQRQQILARPGTPAAG